MMVAQKDLEFVRFLTALEDWSTGYQTGSFEGTRYSVSVERPINGRVTKLYAEALGGSDVVSFNLFQVGDDRPILKPCEMSADKVMRFVIGFELDKQVAALR